MVGQQQQVRVPAREGARRDAGAGGDSPSAAGSGRDAADRVPEVEPMVRAICRGRLGTVDGDDAAQRTLLAVWRTLERGREIKSVPAYAAATARYEVLSSYRDSRRRATPSGKWAEQRWADEAPGPAEQAERVDEVAAATERVEALLGQLTPRQAEVIRAGVLSGRSTAETAEVLGITPTGVHSAQVRAMARLRELCGTRSANPLDAVITQSFKRVTSADREFEQYRGRVGLDAVLAGLPEQTRRVVELRFTQDVPVAVVTQQLDLGKHTVQRLTQEGLAALRAQLGGGHPPGDSPEQRKDTVLPGPAALPDHRQCRTDADTDREFQQYHDRVGWDAAIARLPPEARQVVQLRFTHGLPVTVVARQLHRGTIHVRALTEHGLAVLRAQLAYEHPAGERPERREEDTPHRGRATTAMRDSSPEDAAAVPEVAAVREPRGREVPDAAAPLATTAADTHADAERTGDHNPADLAADDARARQGPPSTAALVARAHAAVAGLPTPRVAPDEDARRDQLARWHTDDHTDNSTDDRGGDEAGCDARRSGGPGPGAGRECWAMTGIGEMS